MLSKLIILCFIAIGKRHKGRALLSSSGQQSRMAACRGLAAPKIQNARLNHSGTKALPSQDVSLIGNNLASLQSSALFNEYQRENRVADLSRLREVR